MLITTRRIAALTASLALLAAGCSSGDEADTPEPEPSTTQAQPEAEPEPEPEPSEEAETEPDTDTQAGDLGPLSEEEAQEARDMLGAVEYADGADAVACDAVFGDSEDSVMSLLLDTGGVTNADEAVDAVKSTAAQIDEYAASAPAELRDHLESLSDTLTQTVTAQDMADVQRLAADTEASMTAVGEYCFGY